MIFKPTCPNRGDARDWICLCPKKGVDLRAYLAQLWNGWLSSEDREAAKRAALNSETTDEELRAVLRALEERASSGLAIWKAYQ